MHTYQWNNRFVQTGGQAPDVFWLYTQFVFFWSALYWTGSVIVHPYFWDNVIPGYPWAFRNFTVY